MNEATLSTLEEKHGPFLLMREEIPENMLRVLLSKGDHWIEDILLYQHISLDFLIELEPYWKEISDPFDLLSCSRTLTYEQLKYYEFEILRECTDNRWV